MNVHALSWFRTRNPSNCASVDMRRGRSSTGIGHYKLLTYFTLKYIHGKILQRVGKAKPIRSSKLSGVSNRSQQRALLIFQDLCIEKLTVRREYTNYKAHR
jgi:hypothetical protein